MWIKLGKNLIIKFTILFSLFLVYCGDANTDDHVSAKSFNLISSLKSVLNNHKLIKATQIDIRASNFRLKQAKGGYYPSFDLTANYGHEHINKYGAGNNTQLPARDATAKITQLTLV